MGFSDECSEWLKANCPPSLLGSEDVAWGGRKAGLTNPDMRLWRERMVGQGWTVPSWSREFGGAGLDADQTTILRREMKRLSCPDPLVEPFGISLLAPALMRFGTHDQKLEHLPRIAQGEVRWCQGFSEPGAGSDLASVQTMAEEDGTNYHLNGHKVWTSFGAFSDWIFCLVRTDPEAPKRDGISFLLVDMATPGVSTRPMDLISGPSGFCEVILEDVVVPVGNRLGDEGQGWTIAKDLLARERGAISEGGGGPIVGEVGGQSLAEAARSRTSSISPTLQDDIARAEMDRLAFQAAVSIGRGERDRIAHASFMKYAGTELTKRRSELRARVLGAQGLGWTGEIFTEEELAATRNWLWSRGYSILGGTSEIQLNMIARRGLGLPTGGQG